MEKEYVGPPQNTALRASLSVSLVSAMILGLMFPMTMGWTSLATARPIIGCFLLAFSVVWLMLLIYSIKDNDPFGMFLNGIFGGFLGLGFAFSFLLGYYAQVSGVQIDWMRVEGFQSLWAAVLMLVVAFVSGALLLALFPSFILLFIFWGGLGCISLGLLSPIYMKWLGPMLGIVGAFYAYVAIALFINASFLKNKLPLGGPLFYRKD
jgi:hypothetical protein